MSSECVKVMVRVRPLNSREKSANCKECVEVDGKQNQIYLKKPNDANSVEKAYTYDSVFSSASTQQLIYESSAFSLVESVFEGYNGTIFAYGQTGCGKTHTMMGNPNVEDEKGIIPRTFSHIINVIESANSKKFLVRVSFLEIYMEEIHDLLAKDSKNRLELKQSPDKGVFVKDLTVNVVKSVSEMEKLMIRGNDNRSVGETAMNRDSSRSHSIFTIYIETSEADEKGRQHIRAGKLNLVDLAGSERQDKTQATGDRLREANKINLSLSALGNVISALVDGKIHHIPYRDSKLTRLLEDSLGGNTKTIMIAAISAADDSYDETSGTLRYASRAKNIKNLPKINADPKDAQLKEYADEINRLKEMLQLQEKQRLQYEQLGSKNGAGGKEDNQEEEYKIAQLQEEIAQEKEVTSQEKQKMLAKEKELEIERAATKQLNEKLQELEANMLKGGQDEQESKKQELQRYEELKKKLKKQQKIKEQLLEEKRKNEESVLRQELESKSLQDELFYLRENNKILRKKLKQAQEEAKEAYNDAEDNKEELLDAVRNLQKENQLNRNIVLMLLSQKEYQTVVEASIFDEDQQIYKVPPFSFKNKEIRFPKLPYAQAMEHINQEKEGRDMMIEGIYEKNEPQKQDKDSRNSIMEMTFYNAGGGGMGSDRQIKETNSSKTDSRGRSKNRKVSQVLQPNQQSERYQQNGSLPAKGGNGMQNNDIMGTQSARKQINGVILEPVGNYGVSQHEKAALLNTMPMASNQEFRKPPKTGLKPLMNAPSLQIGRTQEAESRQQRHDLSPLNSLF